MKKYTAEQKAWFKEFIPGHGSQETAEAFTKKFGIPITASRVHAYMSNNHIRSNTRRGIAPGANKVWTHEIIEFLKANNKCVSAKQMAQMLNEKFNTDFNSTQVKGIRARLKIKSGISGRFEKGHVPPNKGRKGYHTPGSEKGWFKKGHTPYNHMKVGDEAWTTDGYLKVKIAEPNKWKHKHVLEWEKVNGKVPEGYVLIFRSGDRSDCSVENLKLVTKAEHAIMNSQHLRSTDPEITDTAVNLAKLKHRVQQLKKGV